MYTLGIEQLTDTSIRVRVYDSVGSFLYQWIIPQADWDTILTNVGTGGLAAIEAGTADLEDKTADYGVQAGKLGPLSAVS